MKHQRNLILAVLALFVLVGAGYNHVVDAQQDIQSLLIEHEQDKWELFGQGQIDAMSKYYADDFINLGLSPTGAVRQNKDEAFAMLAAIPAMPGAVTLSDFLVVQGSDQSVVVSYQVSSPFGDIYASSVWELRDGEWVTIFYQATPLSSPAPVADTQIAVPFFGRYRSLRAGGGSDAILLNADGTYAVDSGATNEYGTTGRFVINDDVLTLTDDERSDVPECTGDQRSANYHYTFTGGSLVLTSMDDTCVGRQSYFADRTWLK